MCSRVCRSSPHSQLVLFSGKNCLRNSPVYACPVRHWISRPNTSRWSLSSMKCLVGLREGGILLEIANLPFRGAFCQSRTQAVCVDALARRSANARDVLIGAFHASWVASFASSSALSFPAMLQWLGHQAISIEWVWSLSRNLVIFRWNLTAYSCPGCGLGSNIAPAAAELSTKKWMLLISG